MFNRKGRLLMKQNEKNVMKIIRAYCLRNPVVFLETELNIKLNWFQKFLINLAFKWGVKDVQS